MLRARERLEEARRERDQELDEARDSMTGAISTASLLLMSGALQAGKSRVTRAESALEKAEAPLETVRVALSESSRERMTAERWQHQRRVRELRELDRKEDRLASDQAAQRSVRRAE